MTCSDPGRGVLAMLVALIFSSPGDQLNQGKAHLQDLGYADISTRRAVMEGRERAAFGPVKGSVVLERNGGCATWLFINLSHVPFITLR